MLDKEDKRRLRVLYSRYKGSAKKRGLTFRLTIEDFEKRWKDECFYCGHIIEDIGLDRVDNSEGYTPKNIISCCWWCNQMKKEEDVFDFIHHCAAVTATMKKRLNNFLTKISE